MKENYSKYNCAHRKTQSGKYPCYIAMLLVVRICDGTYRLKAVNVKVIIRRAALFSNHVVAFRLERI
jgi:hypothetical protein